MRLLLIMLLCSVAFFSCRKDFDTDLLTTPSLKFSKDTVYLDTVFTNIGSSTYNLKVYNNSNNAVRISSIKLDKEQASYYRLNVDGKPGKTFENVEILGKDSIYIFIETTVDYNAVENPLYTDKIIFETGLTQQKVQLVTLVKDAYFLYPQQSVDGIETITLSIDKDGKPNEIQGFYLENNATFTNEKPYVIYGYCGVKENNTLTIEAGANIHFHSNSGLLISKNASLNINGTLAEKVLIEGDRLEPEFSEIPGQWGAIWLRAGSKNNTINNTKIKNASIGIIVDSLINNNTTLTIKNTEIYNSSNFGILARGASIVGENVVINNSGQASLACTFGGSYTFTHSTFTNFWTGSFREYPSVFINNYSTNNNGETVSN
ncbi:MAG TPA: right-handed parallel beta-helix repeat-containing protein, partial [Flavobacteriaceae bacterium]|nr:right-handed parallel beta-helix repeat-containing protein [Flavobacteriaceae bacterium]